MNMMTFVPPLMHSIRLILLLDTSISSSDPYCLLRPGANMSLLDTHVSLLLFTTHNIVTYV